jgi:general secretion pathway protein K
MAAAHLAEAGVEQALRELSADSRFVAVGDDGLLNFYNPNNLLLPRLPRTRVRLGAGEFSYRISDEQSRINLNRAPPERLDRLLQCLGVDKIVRDKIVDSILDWVDQSDDYYLKLPSPYRARNGAFESVHELLQVKGVTPQIFDGVGGKPGLADAVTVRGTQPQVNINTAPPLVFCGMGVSDAEISEFIQRRRDAPPLTNADRLATRGFGANTDTFRIEAEGLIDGRPRARVTAIVQKPANAGNPVTILEWSGIR